MVEANMFWGFQGSDFSNYGLLSCDTVQNHGWIPTFWKNTQPPRSTLEREAAHSSETSVSTYETARCHNPEDHNLNSIIADLQIMKQHLLLFTDFITPPSLKHEILNTPEVYYPSHHSLLTSILHCSTRILSHIFLSDLRVFYAHYENNRISLSPTVFEWHANWNYLGLPYSRKGRGLTLPPPQLYEVLWVSIACSYFGNVHICWVLSYGLHAHFH
jgi:hypothetical protein